MANRRLSLSGLFAALLVLMVQLAAGVPDGRPGTQVPGTQLPGTQVSGTQVFGTICHVQGDTPEVPPPHRPDCLVCPLCAAFHAPPLTILPLGMAVPRPELSSEPRGHRPDRAAAPRVEPRPPGQPRAPPGFA